MKNLKYSILWLILNIAGILMLGCTFILSLINHTGIISGMVLCCILIAVLSGVGIRVQFQKHQRLIREHRQLHEHMNIYMRDRLWGRLLVPDKSSKSWLAGECTRYGLVFPKTNFVVGVLSLRDYPETLNSLYSEDGADNTIYSIIRNYVEGIFKDSHIIAHLTVRYEEFVIILNYTPSEIGDDVYAVKNSLKMAVDKLIYDLEMKEGICLGYCMGKECKDISEIPNSFASACTAKEYCDMLGLDERKMEYHTTIEDILRFNSTMSVTSYRSLSLQRQLTASIESKNYTKAKSTLNELIKTEFEEPPPVGTLKIKLYGILYIIYTAVSSTAMRSEDNIYELFQISDDWLSSAGIKDVEQYIDDNFDKLIDMSNPVASHQEIPDHVSQVMHYLQENYRDASLNLNCVADRFELNPQYLSKIFRKYMNCSVSDYLQTLRIEEAKKLLSQGYTVQDASMHSGFSNTRTFSRIFMKYAGVSPGKYSTNTL